MSVEVRRIREEELREFADVPPGEGTLPFPAIVAAGRAAGVEWYIVEQDEPADPLSDAGRSLAYLRTLATS